jgi:hypothetical protein
VTNSPDVTFKHRVSYSQYSMWATCPKQWKLAYFDKLRPRESNIYGVFGTAIHEAIQEWLTEAVYHPMAPDSYIQSWDLLGRFREFLKLNFTKNTTVQENGAKLFPCSMTELQTFFEEGSFILDDLKVNYFKHFPVNHMELLGIELSLDTMVTEHVKFVGYLDIVLRHRATGEILIIDLKTSTKGWYYEKKDQKKLQQLLLYKDFYSKLFDVPMEDITGKFVILTRRLQKPGQERIESFEPVQTASTVKKAVKGFSEFIGTTYTPDGDVAVERLVATPSANACRFCPFKEKKELCDVGVIV